MPSPQRVAIHRSTRGFWRWQRVALALCAALGPPPLLLPACDTDAVGELSAAPAIDDSPQGAQRPAAGPELPERGASPEPNRMPAPTASGAGAAAPTAASAAAHKQRCHVRWTAEQGPNLAPITLGLNYPPWLLPMTAVGPDGALVIGVNAPHTSLSDEAAPDVQRYSAVVAKIGADCQPVWARPLRLGDESTMVTLLSVQSDAEGDVLLLGWFRGDLDYGQGAVANMPSGTGLFISKLDRAGVHVWTRAFASGETLSEVRVGPQGQLVLSGSAPTRLDLGAGSICATLADGDTDATARAQPSQAGACNYIAVLDTDGQLQWSRARLKHSRRELAVFDRDGNVLQTRDDTTSGLAERSEIAKLDPQGTLVWKVDVAAAFGISIRTAWTHKERQVSAGRDGSLFHLEPQVSEQDEAASDDDGLLYGALFDPHRSRLSRLDGNGAALWSEQVADFAGGRVGAMAADVHGDGVLLAGEFTGSAQLAAQWLQAHGSRDVFVMGLDGAGTPRWSARVGDEDSEYVGDLALAGDGSVWVSGWIGTTRVSGNDTVYDNLLREGIFVTRLTAED